MSIEPDRDQFFQYATFAVIGATLVVGLCYLLIFLNPRVNPIAALRPVPPTQDLAAFQFPPTWTPIPTSTPTSTPTNTPTTLPTDTPTVTPVPTDTPPPTVTPTVTPVPTQAPPTAAPSRRPTTRYVPPPPPPPPPPANTPAPQFVLIKNQPWPNCGTWYLQGTVWSNGYGSGFVPGTLVRVWVNGAIYATDTAGSHNRNNPAYWEVLFPNNQAVGGTVAIVDPAGNLLSPQYSFQLTSGCKSSSSVNEIIMDFSRQ